MIKIEENENIEKNIDNLIEKDNKIEKDSNNLIMFIVLITSIIFTIVIVNMSNKNYEKALKQYTKNIEYIKGA